MSYLDGIFAANMAGFTQDYFIPYLLLLQANSRHIGILNSLPNLFASLIQLTSADLTRRFNSRKRVITLFVFLQALTLFLMAGLAFTGDKNPWPFIILAVLFAGFGALANPAWGSLMSDLVPAEKRGEYFGWRNRNLGLVIVCSTFLAGALLQGMQRINIFYGFVLLFGTAFLSRMISWYFLCRMEEPALVVKKEDDFTFFEFLKRLKHSNFAQFALFVSLMSFSVNLASPFFAVFMLKDLKFSYTLFTTINVVSTFTIYTTMSRWGRHADKIGNLKIVKLTAPLIGIIPLLWVINHHPLFLLAIQVFAGF